MLRSREDKLQHVDVPRCGFRAEEQWTYRSSVAWSLEIRPTRPAVESTVGMRCAYWDYSTQHHPAVLYTERLHIDTCNPDPIIFAYLTMSVRHAAAGRLLVLLPIRKVRHLGTSISMRCHVTSCPQERSITIMFNKSNLTTWGLASGSEVGFM